MATEKLERIVKFMPAFDKRNPDPHKDYGIGAVRCIMALKGEKGAVTFSFSTGILMENTITEYIKDGRARYELTEYGHYFLNKPMGYSVDYHDHQPHFEGQDIGGECLWLNGEKCYCDGSMSVSDEFLKALIEEGDEAVWKKLETWYNEDLKGKK